MHLTGCNVKYKYKVYVGAQAFYLDQFVFVSDNNLNVLQCLSKPYLVYVYNII